MPRKRTRRKRPEETHSHLTIKVDGYEAQVRAAVNYAVHQPQHVPDLDEDDPLYEFTSALTITGTATYPEGRAGDAYELRIYGGGKSPKWLGATLGDVQARGKDGSPQYRTWRGRQVPVFCPPGGLGHLNKTRGQACWTGWVFAAPQFVSDAMILLGQGKKLFLTIHEVREKRARRIEGISLQTNDPDAE